MRACAIVFVALFAPACSSSDDGSGPPRYDGGGGSSSSDSGSQTLSCDNVPCGGDLVGTWKNAKLCSDVTVLGEVDIETFSDDGKYKATLKDSTSIRTGTWVSSNSTATILLDGSTAEYEIDFCIDKDVLWARYTPETVILSVKLPD